MTIGITGTQVNPSLEEYTAEKGSPYASEYFALDTPFTYLPAEMQQDLQAIDRFVELELAEKGIKPTIRTYNSLIQQLQMEMGTEDDSPTELVERMAGYAKNMLKINGIDDVKKTLSKKLKSLRRSKDMDNEVLRAIGKRII